MVFTTDAFVLRSIDVGDYDRVLTLLTPENGQITVMAKGARSKKSQFSAITQPYIYANFEIYRKSDMNWLRGGSVTEYFSGLRDDLTKLSLATYLSDVARDVTGEFVPAVDIMRMTLNSLYAVSRDKFDIRLVKAVYEWRTAGYAGYMPVLTRCCKCHSGGAETMYLDVMNGRLICPSCLNKFPATKAEISNAAYEDMEYERSILIPMGIGAVAAAQYALTAMPERMFSFRIQSESDKDDFCRAGETYLLNHLERNFESLDFYKTILK